MMTPEIKKRQARESYRRTREKKKDDIRYRLGWLLQQARVRAKKKNLEAIVLYLKENE